MRRPHHEDAADGAHLGSEAPVGMMYMCIYIYIYIYNNYVYMYIHTYIHIHTCTHSYMFVCGNVMLCYAMSCCVIV